MIVSLLAIAAYISSKMMMHKWKSDLQSLRHIKETAMQLKQFDQYWITFLSLLSGQIGLKKKNGLYWTPFYGNRILATHYRKRRYKP